MPFYYDIDGSGEEGKRTLEGLIRLRAGLKKTYLSDHSKSDCCLLRGIFVILINRLMESVWMKQYTILRKLFLTLILSQYRKFIKTLRRYIV